MRDIATLDSGGRDSTESTVRRAAAGDEAAFERLVADHHAAMSRVAYVVAGDLEIARDAVQAAWAIAWRRLSGLRDVEQVRPWLIAIAANEARQAVRRRRRRPVVDLSDELAAPTRTDPAEGIAMVDLDRALRRLSPDDRALIALRFVAGLDSGEIAGPLGLSASGVRSRLARLLDRLRMDLDHD